MKKNYGFTLIELVIVIAIIAVLATTIVSIINPVEYQKVARDTVRLSNLNSISQSLELYFAENKSYPDALANGTLDLSAYNSRIVWDDPSNCKYKYEKVSNSAYNLYTVKESKSFSVPAGQVLVTVVNDPAVVMGCNVQNLKEVIKISNQQ
jgi:prepilin-type N-terminal cleavage/methylation domain-containing protein